MFRACGFAERHRRVVQQMILSARAPAIFQSASILHDRVVQQAVTLAARVAGGADALAAQQLVNLLRALTGCLSLLRQRVHDELLAQALGVSLWSCAQVQPSVSRDPILSLCYCPVIRARPDPNQTLIVTLARTQRSPRTCLL